MLKKHHTIQTHRNLLSLAIALGLSYLPVQSFAATNTFGEAVGTDSTAVGQSAIATAINGLANGKAAVATGDNLTKEQFSTLQAEESAKLAQKADLTNQLANLKTQLAKAQQDKENFQKQLDEIDRQIAQNEEDLAKRKELQAQKEQIIANSNVKSENYREFVNYYNVLSSLDWTKYASTDTGLSAMREQLKAETAKFAPNLANQISDEKYNEYIRGYVNVETTLTTTLNNIKTKLGYAISNSDISRQGNATRLNDIWLTDYIKLEQVSKENVTAKNYLDTDYIAMLNKNLANLGASDSEIITKNNANYIKEHRQNNDFYNLFLQTNLLFNETSSRSTNSVYSSNDLNGDSLGSGFVNSGSWLLNFGFNMRTAYNLKSTYYGKPINNFYKHSLNIVLPSTLSDYSSFNPTSFIIGLAFNETNPLINEATDRYTQFKPYVDLMVNLYENIDTNYQGATMVDVASVKQAMQPHYLQWKEAQTLLNMYNDIQTMSAGAERQAKQAEYVERLNKFRTGDNLALLRSFAAADTSIISLANPNRIKYNDGYQQFLADSIREYKDWLLSEEPNLIGYNRTDEYISQLETIANQLKEIDAQMPAEPTGNPSRTEAENNLTNAEKTITDTETQITNVTELINAIKPSLTERGINSIAVGTDAFASGVASIAVGNNTVVIGNQSTAIGRNNLVTGNDSHAFGNGNAISGNQSLALGNDNIISGEKSIAIGVGHKVSGNRSTTLGDPNVVSGNDTTVLGNNNNVASNNVMVLGNNVTVAEGFDNAVVLGGGSAVAKANPTQKITVAQAEYNFAGITPESVVSVGAVGAERQIINVAAGRIEASSTDAINGSQLYAAIAAINDVDTRLRAIKPTTQVIGGGTATTVTGEGNIVVDNSTPNTAVVKLADDVNLGQNGSLTVGGVVIKGDTINAGNNVINGVAAGNLAADSKDAVNGSQLYATNQNVTNVQNQVNKGLNFADDSGKVVNRQLGETQPIKGSENILTAFDVDGALTVKLKDDVKVKSVAANTAKVGNVTINNNGIDAGKSKITNVANGDVNETSQDAVNGSQLYAVANAINNRIDTIKADTNWQKPVANLNYRVDNLEDKVNKLDKRRKAGTASALAAAGLPQPIREGQSGIVAAAGQYGSQTGLAVGYTRASDNGRLIIRAAVTTNSQKEFGGNVGVGYFW